MRLGRPRASTLSSLMPQSPARPGRLTPRTLIIDNYDSYTYNLYQLVADVNGVEPLVIQNDRSSVAEIRGWLDAGVIHNIIISPGPGTPEVAADVGIVPDVLRNFADVPILGVCLGHQALASVHGSRIVRAPEPVHGRLSHIEHNGHPIFCGIPSGDGFTVVRYHSLVADAASIPGVLQPICWTAGGHVALTLRGDSGIKRGAGPGDRLVMGLAHRHRPHVGVQFHPESIGSAFGAQMLRNFAALTAARLGGPSLPAACKPPVQCAPAAAPRSSTEPPWIDDGSSGASAPLQLAWRRLPHPAGVAPEALLALLATPGAASPGEDTFWLDSSDTERGRFSFLGGRGGALWRRFTYELPSPTARRAAAHQHRSAPFREPAQATHTREAECQASGCGVGAEAHWGGEAGTREARRACECSSEPCGRCAGTVGVLSEMDAHGASSSRRCRFFDWMDGFLRSRRLAPSSVLAADLPFDFWGGLVGYLGYEMKAECGAAQNAHSTRHADSAFFFADRLLALDHCTASIYLLALHTDDLPARSAAEEWLDIHARVISGLASANSPDADNIGTGESLAGAQQPPGELLLAGQETPTPCERAPFVLAHGREKYLENVAACREALYAGESYEICLTTALHRQGAPDPWQLYRVLRAINKAPYAAWLNFGSGQPVICCSSPERFLRLGRGACLEARPIKGTAARVADDPAADAAAAASLAASEKDRAENLMIVDLLRNDLGHVCVPGSVHVPEMMAVESFASVHQLVSTVRGTRAPSASITDCLRAAFPGGSMTGAPKLRSMEIIDAVEGRPRGVYSGSIGYVSVNGTFDFNIVIRTAVVHEDAITIGAGGAVVVQSDPQEEYSEMLLKAARLLAAVGICDGLQGAASVQLEETLSVPTL